MKDGEEQPNKIGFVAIDKAGHVYEVFIKSLEESIIAAGLSKDAMLRLEDIRHRLLGALAIVEEQQYKLRNRQ